MDIQVLTNRLQSVGEYMDNWRWTEDTPFSSVIYPLSTAIIYLVVVFSLKMYMKDRKPFTLKGVSLVHNFNLIVLSITMMVGVLQAAYQQAQDQGVFSLLCERTPHAVNGRIGWWIYVFYISKYYELFDTVILALKKKPLIFLHVFHHMAMVPVTWQWLNDQWLVGSWWCVFVNSFIHTIMYYYYFQATLGNDCWFKRYITTSQIIQFLTGTAIVSNWFYIRNTENCQGGVAPAVVSYVINTLFIGLFVRFYIKSYTSKKKDATVHKKSE